MIRNRKDLPAELQSPHALRPGPRINAPTRNAPFISVLVPVRNEGRSISSTLRQLLEQSYDADRFEIIVADGESTDDTREHVRTLQDRHPNLHLVDNPGRWSSAGRNAALEMARGELIVIVDGHCDIQNPQYLPDLADAFERSGAACIGRPQPQDLSNATPLQQAIAACRASRLGHHPESFIYSSGEQFVKASSVAIAYRRTVFDTVGTFDERFDACEDVEFNHRVDRAGLRCFFTPRVQVCYHPRGTLQGLFRQMVRYGRGRVRLCRKHPDTFSLRGFVPALFVLGMILGPMLGIVSLWLALACAGSLTTYSLLLFGMSAVISWKQRDPRLLFWAPPVFLTIHTGAGVGMLLELVRPEKPSTRRAKLGRELDRAA